MPVLEKMLYYSEDLNYILFSKKESEEMLLAHVVPGKSIKGAAGEIFENNATHFRWQKNA